MERQTLLEALREIQANDYNLPENASAHNYLSGMLQFIGDPDPELRDSLICSTFYMWIPEKRYLDNDDLRNLLETVISDRYLFLGIGSEGDHSVLTRSFTLLLIALILAAHRDSPFLNNHTFNQVKDNLIQYYRAEKDARGYLEVEGWAHAVAHGADALDQLVRCPESDGKTCQDVLQAIKEQLWNGKYTFGAEEDERITTIIMHMIEEDLLPITAISTWVKDIQAIGTQKKCRTQQVNRINSKNVVRCLYFRLSRNNEYDSLCKLLIEAEAILNNFI